MNVDALIFDVDGTLADTEDVHRQCFNEAFAEQGLPWYWGHRVYAELLLTTGGKERIAHFIDRLRLPEAEASRLAHIVPALHAAKTCHYTRRIASGAVPLRPGVAVLLDQARRAGLKLAIASTTTRPNIDALLEHTLGRAATTWFDAIVAGDDVERKKPAPDIHVRVLDLLGVPPTGCIAFEDSHAGLRAAKAASLFTVVTPTAWTRHEDFATADLLLDDLGMVDGLDYFRYEHSRRPGKSAEAA